MCCHGPLGNSRAALAAQSSLMPFRVAVSSYSRSSCRQQRVAMAVDLAGFSYVVAVAALSARNSAWSAPSAAEQPPAACQCHLGLAHHGAKSLSASLSSSPLIPDWLDQDDVRRLVRNRAHIADLRDPAGHIGFAGRAGYFLHIKPKCAPALNGTALNRRSPP